MHEPYTFLNGLTVTDMEDLLEDIKVTCVCACACVCVCVFVFDSLPEHSGRNFPSIFLVVREMIIIIYLFTTLIIEHFLKSTITKCFTWAAK